VGLRPLPTRLLQGGDRGQSAHARPCRFQLLDLHDYLGQGTALIGLLDTFWESKGYVTPEEFRQFCGPVVPLARLSKRIYTTADKLETPVEIANFGATSLTNVTTKWAIIDTKGNGVADGEFATTNIPIGKNFTLGNIFRGSVQTPARPAIHPRRLGQSKP